jgi:hypothetical protein
MTTQPKQTVLVGYSPLAVFKNFGFIVNMAQAQF